MTEPAPQITAAQRRKWRKYLADERMEAATYYRLAKRRRGEDGEILKAIADAEKRHEKYWLELLGEHAYPPPRASLRSRFLAFLAGSLGSVFTLALMQRAEQRSDYETDGDAPAQMAADERVHSEVIRALAARSRQKLSGGFRAAIFGANDGLVSNLSLIVGMAGANATNSTILTAGVAGLLAGALSMAAGEYISVRSQRELLEASLPASGAGATFKTLDFQANELELLFRARGFTPDQARIRAANLIELLARDEVLSRQEYADLLSDSPAPAAPASAPAAPAPAPAPAAPAADSPAASAAASPDTAPAAETPAKPPAETEFAEVGQAFTAALASFCFFAVGAAVPVLPYLLGLTGYLALGVAAGLVGIALLFTGGIVGILSGAAPFPRALRQLAIGIGAGAATYLLGLAFGTLTV